MGLKDCEDNNALGIFLNCSILYSSMWLGYCTVVYSFNQLGYCTVVYSFVQPGYYTRVHSYPAGVMYVHTDVSTHCMCILDRTQGDMSSLKKPAKYVQYVYRLEGICLFIYPSASASFLGVIHFCRYVFQLINENQSYSVQLCNKFTIVKFMITKFIRNRFTHKIFICSKFT